MKAVADGNNRFAIDLYKKLAATTDGNIVVSPFSVRTALAMTYAGARGQTAEEMAKVLHFDLPPDRLHPAFGSTIQRLQSGKDKSYRLNIANALWGQRGMPLQADFLDLTRRNYDGGLREIDFVGNNAAAREAINQWIEGRTEGVVKDLLKAEDIESDTRLVLTNAIYFRGTWKHPFDKSRTGEADFETSPGISVKVPTMRQTAEFRAAESPEFRLLELPYGSNRLAMVVLLPVKRCGLREVEAGLTSQKLSDALAQLNDVELSVSMPRLRIRSRFEFKRPLREMGMSQPFSEDADFTGMTSDTKLRIKDVIHGGSVEVDEVGTVAAAATAAVMVAVSAPPRFQADHPFLFLIRDIGSGAVLFMGRVNDPR